MQQQLINHSPDLLKLKEDGLHLEEKGGFLLVYHIPYVNSRKEVAFGTLVTELTLAGDKTAKPGTHVAYFSGDHPHNKDGTIIKAIQHSSETKKLAEGVIINHSFSNKPLAGYSDYYEKITTYIAVISSQAKAIDDTATEKIFAVVESEGEDSVFNYVDSNSSRAEINGVSKKLKGQKIAIIGLGGTGSYILDLVGKTPVGEIHMFDGDIYLQHNAFRSPGAPSIDKLRERVKKTDYFREIYSRMHKNILSHSYNICSDNLNELVAMDFVFICVDNGESKESIINFLLLHNKPFVDVGIGVHNVDDSLMGHVRVTACTGSKKDHLQQRINFKDGGKNDYKTNIQIAELNALNATLAVIKWKKLCNFYQDFSNEFHTLYSINDGKLFNEDYSS